jgi:hydrogenase-4 component E
LILLSVFVLMAGKRIKSYITALRAQAVLIAASTCVIGIRNLTSNGGIDLLIVCAVIVALKVIYIPHMLHKTWASVEYTVEKDFLMNIPMLVMICCGIVVLTYVSLAAVGSFAGNALLLLVNSISVVLIGLFFIISRKKAIGHIAGLIVIENGLFVTALFATDGLPFIVDMGIFVDLVTSVLILGTMVFKISDRFESIDIDKLNNLRG